MKPTIEISKPRFQVWVLLVLGASAWTAKGIQSEWVHPGADGKLIYKTTPAGDRIMDFSYAGYMGGGVALPDVRAKMTLKPAEGDNTAAIQEAIDKVAAMNPVGGFRGAVLLAPGDYPCSGTITIRAGGVVLRGSGSGAGGSTIKMIGSRHGAIAIGGGRSQPAPTSDDSDAGPAAEPAPSATAKAAQTSIADAYVPSGAATFTVIDASGFKVGDMISIRRPTTAAWVKFMEMDTLKRNGRPQTWIALTRSGTQQRKITAISGNKLTVDVPLADSYDAKYLNPPGTSVTKVGPASPIMQVGIEHLHIQCPPLETAYGSAPYSAIRINGDDCWVKDVFCEETMNSTVLGGKRITMQQVVVKHTFPNLGASKPTDFSIEGSQNLLDRCQITGDNMYFVWTGSLQPGPNVLLNCTFRGRGSRIQPHQRWATGMLIDNCTVPDGGIDYPNRGVAGSGHGWTMGWGAVWNSVANFYVIQNPPGTVNWAIGCIGDRLKTARYFDTGPILPEGIFDSHGTPVTPQSLYLAQLAERLGPQALTDIGYASNTADAFPNKSVVRLPEWRDVDPVLGPDLGLHRPINATNPRGGAPQFSGEKAVDGNDNTYWAVNDGTTQATLEADMEGPVQINALVLGEAMELGSRVQEYKVEGQVDSDYVLLSQGTTIGQRKVDRFPKITVWKVKLTILKSNGYPAIRKLGLYLSTAGDANATQK